MKFKIERTVDEKILDRCALMMSQTEPWITLQRDLDGCKEAMRVDYKEIYVATDEDKLLGFVVLQVAGAFKGYHQSLCVSPEARSSGLGTALISFAEE